MSTSSDQVNYAHAIGFDSVAAAVIFAILYVPLFGWFILQSFKHPTYVHIVLSLFCASEFFLKHIAHVVYGVANEPRLSSSNHSVRHSLGAG